MSWMTRKTAWPTIGTLLLAGCSTTAISLQSSPEKAEIYASATGFSNQKLIGMTPFVADASVLGPDFGGAGPLYVEFRKPGYLPARILVTDLSARDLTVSLELARASGLEEPEKLNTVVDLAFEVQRLARAGRYPEALEKVTRLQTEAPLLSTTYELEGGIHYLQKKYPDALDAFRTAVRLEPKNAEAVRMRNMLEAALGVRRTATSEPPTAAEAASAAAVMAAKEAEGSSVAGVPAEPARDPAATVGGVVPASGGAAVPAPTDNFPAKEAP